jgi:hypothetical protein
LHGTRGEGHIGSLSVVEGENTGQQQGKTRAI